MLWWGLHDRSPEQVIEFFASQEDAEETLDVILGDEPQWAGILAIVPLELGELGPN